MQGLATRHLLEQARRTERDLLAPECEGPPADRSARLDDQRADQIERRWDRLYRIAMWAVMLASFFMIGYHSRPIAPAETPSSLALRSHAPSLAPGDTRCVMDWRENCLACAHRDPGGRLVQTSHC